MSIVRSRWFRGHVSGALTGPSGFLVVLGLVIAGSGCGSSSNDGGSPGGGNGGDSDGGGVQDAASPGDGASSLADGGAAIAVPLSACTPLVYSADVAIGGSQTFTLIVDTGSTTLGVAGAGCTSCGVTPLYTAGATATDTKTTATSQFGTGNWSGEVYQDSVGFASDPSVSMKFASITTQTGFFQAGSTCGASGSYDGIIGFDRATAAVGETNAFFDQFVAAKGIPDIFATQLCDSGGTLWLGGYAASATTASPQYTSFTTDIYSSYYYTVGLQSIAVGGTSVTVTVPSGAYTDTVMDTGTSAIVLSTAAVSSLTSAIAGTQGFQQIFGADGGASFFANETPCANVTQTKAELDSALPPLTMTFGTGATAISVQALATESYLMPYPGLGWCSSFDAMDPSAEFPLAGILGSPFLRSNVVIFDRAGSRVGFAPHAPCVGE